MRSLLLEFKVPAPTLISPQNQFNYAQKIKDLGRLDKAAQSYSQIITQYPELSSEAYFNWGCFYLVKGDAREALKIFEMGAAALTFGQIGGSWEAYKGISENGNSKKVSCCSAHLLKPARPVTGIEGIGLIIQM